MKTYINIMLKKSYVKLYEHYKNIVFNYIRKMRKKKVACKNFYNRTLILNMLAVKKIILFKPVLEAKVTRNLFNLSFFINPIINPVIRDLRNSSLHKGLKILIAGRLTRKERAAFFIGSKVKLLASRRIFRITQYPTMRFGIVSLKIFETSLSKYRPYYYKFMFKDSVVLTTVLKKTNLFPVIRNNPMYITKRYHGTKIVKDAATKTAPNLKNASTTIVSQGTISSNSGTCSNPQSKVNEKISSQTQEPKGANENPKVQKFADTTSLNEKKDVLIGKQFFEQEKLAKTAKAAESGLNQPLKLAQNFQKDSSSRITDLACSKEIVLALPIPAGLRDSVQERLQQYFQESFKQKFDTFFHQPILEKAPTTTISETSLIIAKENKDLSFEGVGQKQNIVDHYSHAYATIKTITTHPEHIGAISLLHLYSRGWTI